MINEWPFNKITTNSTYFLYFCSQKIIESAVFRTHKQN